MKFVLLSVRKLMPEEALQVPSCKSFAVLVQDDFEGWKTYKKPYILAKVLH